MQVALALAPVYVGGAGDGPVLRHGLVPDEKKDKKRKKKRVYSYSVGARCLLCWGVIGLFVTDCAIPMDGLFLVLGGFGPAN